MNNETLTINDLHALSVILRAAQTNALVTFAPDVNDSTNIRTGIVRSIGDERGNFLGPNDDVRDAFVRITATFEHFLPVRDVIDLIEAGLFVEN